MSLQTKLHTGGAEMSMSFDIDAGWANGLGRLNNAEKTVDIRKQG
jgi:hypothetical protein